LARGESERQQSELFSLTQERDLEIQLLTSRDRSNDHGFGKCCSIEDTQQMLKNIPEGMEVEANANIRTSLRI